MCTVTHDYSLQKCHGILGEENLYVVLRRGESDFPVKESYEGCGELKSLPCSSRDFQYEFSVHSGDCAILLVTVTYNDGGSRKGFAAVFIHRAGDCPRCVAGCLVGSGLFYEHYLALVNAAFKAGKD